MNRTKMNRILSFFYLFFCLYLLSCNYTKIDKSAQIQLLRILQVIKNNYKKELLKTWVLEDKVNRPSEGAEIHFKIGYKDIYPDIFFGIDHTHGGDLLMDSLVTFFDLDTLKFKKWREILYYDSLKAHISSKLYQPEEHLEWLNISERRKTEYKVFFKRLSHRLVYARVYPNSAYLRYAKNQIEYFGGYADFLFGFEKNSKLAILYHSIILP